MEITAYISINILLFYSWLIFLYGEKDYLSIADRLIGAFIAGLTQIIATEMLLGVVFKQLYPLPLFLLNVLIATGVLIYSLMSGGSRGMYTEIRNESVRIFGIIRGDKILLCIFCLFFISLWWLVLLGYLFPSYSWDALYYHLPIAGQILQSGSIQEHAIPSFIQQYINIFPKNINLFFVWNIIFLRSDHLVDLSQLVFTIFGLLSIYSMAVKLKMNEKYAIYSSLLFFFTPVLIFQATINYVDAAVSVLFLIAVNYLIYDEMWNAGVRVDGRHLKQRRAVLILSGLAAGILLGSKPTAPLFIVVILSAIIAGETVTYFKLKPLSSNSTDKGYFLKHSLTGYLIYFILPVSVMGGYWYIRNWILYGNPVYFMDVSIFNVTLFKGMKSDWVEPAPQIIESLNYLTRLIYVWLERVGYYMYDSRLSGFGPIWFILFLPVIIFSLVHAFIKKKYKFIFVSIILLIAFLIHPRNWTTRYVIFIVGLGALSFGFALEYFDERGKTLKIITLLLVAYTFLTVNSPCIMPEKIKEFILLPADERTLARHKPFNIDIKVQKEYGYWIWIDNNISRGDTLVYTFESFDLDTSRPFFTAPLWNSEFSNKVVYVKADTYNEWLNALQNNNASFILIKRNSVEDEWIEKERKLFYSLSWMGNLTEKFKVVYSDEHYNILKFMGAGKGKAER